MNVLIKRSGPTIQLPFYATPGSACFDIATSNSETVIVQKGSPIVFPTGLFFEIEEGFAMMVYSRSGHGFKNDMRLSNCVGVIDSDYRGELFVKLTADNQSYTVKPYERIAQAMIIPLPKVTFKVANFLSDSPRGVGGFGSTGEA